MSEDTLHHPLKDLCIRICNFAKYHCGNYDLLDSDYNFIKSLENMAFDYLDYHYIGEEDFEALNTCLEQFWTSIRAFLEVHFSSFSPSWFLT